MLTEPIDLSSTSLWERAKTILLNTLQDAHEKSQADRYLGMISKVTMVDNNFVFSTLNQFAADLLKNDYSEKIRYCFGLAGAPDVTLTFVVDESAMPSLIVPKSLPPKKSQKISTFVSTMPLNDEYTFEEFVRGPSNSFAFAAAKGVVEKPGKSSYNPLFIYGGTGLGKTHLMQAIGNELRKRDPSLDICYLTTEEYLNEFINCMKDNTLRQFKNKYRSLDVLLLDDVQFLKKGQGIQEEFFNTFNALKQANKQIVMTCDVAPKKIPQIEERLVSRFEGGMLQEIELPSYETRLAILKKKNENSDVNVPEKILEFIADNIKSHVRAMEGALGKINVYLSACPNAEINEEILHHILKDFIDKEKNLRKLTIDEIQQTVCRKYDVKLEQILSPERTQSIVTPRQLAMYISRKYTANSLPEIAKKFEKTHATILHGVKTIEKRLDVEDDLKAMLSDILFEFGYTTSDKLD